jgi:hypothetical protein
MILGDKFCQWDYGCKLWENIYNMLFDSPMGRVHEENSNRLVDYRFWEKLYNVLFENPLGKVHEEDSDLGL